MSPMPASAVPWQCACGSFQGKYNSVLAHKSQKRSAECRGEMVLLLEPGRSEGELAAVAAAEPGRSGEPLATDSGPPPARYIASVPNEHGAATLHKSSGQFPAGMYSAYDYLRTVGIEVKPGQFEPITTSFEETVADVWEKYWEEHGYRLVFARVHFAEPGTESLPGDPLPLGSLAGAA